MSARRIRAHVQVRVLDLVRFECEGMERFGRWGRETVLLDLDAEAARVLMLGIARVAGSSIRGPFDELHDAARATVDILEAALRAAR